MKKIFLILLFSTALGFTTHSQASVYATDSMNVINYNINLDIVHLSNENISGYAEITFKAKYPQQEKLYFDLLELNVDSVFINNQQYSFQYNDTLLSIPADTSLNLSDTLTARIYYHGQPIIESANWGGFHFLSDSSLAFNLGIAFKAKPHNYGKVWFPCADNFTDHATYDFHITTKSQNMAVCNGTLDSTTANGIGTKTWYWRLDQAIPTYLASVAVSDFAVIENTYQGQQKNIPVFLHVAPGDSTDALGTFRNLHNILSVYEQRFGPYRWPRVGYVGTTQGAMEHATSIALPRNCIDSTLNCESLLAHELSHHWFGDLVTCETAKDMWLNEGWAVYCEAIYKEGLHGKQAYKDYMRDKLHEVLRTAHVDDGDYRALYGIPHDYTYGTTVYDKGATVVHSLRNYLGDSVFFNTMKAYLDTFAFSHASTADMNQFINNYTNKNVDEFFNAWVYRPGFSHFSADSFKVTATPGGYQTKVYLKQRVLGTNQLANKNKIEIGFINKKQEITYRTVTFSGKDTVATFNTSDLPREIFIDPEEKISDATTDQYQTIKNTGKKPFNDTYCTLDVQNIQDSALLRITHNWLPPEDTVSVQPSLFHLSGRRYWKVEGIFPAGFSAKAAMEYKKYGNLDGDLITSVYDSLSILYKPGKDDFWRPVSFSRNGSVYAGELIIDSLKKGYYVLGKYDKSLDKRPGINEQKFVKIQPNPADSYLQIKNFMNKELNLYLFNSTGQTVKREKIKKDENELKISVSKFDPGIYFLHVVNTDSKAEQSKKVVIQR